MTTTHAPNTTFITIDRVLHAGGWTVTVQRLDNPFDDNPRREHVVTAEQRDEVVSTITAEHEAAGRTVVVIQPRTPAAYHVDEMALRDYAPAPR